MDIYFQGLTSVRVKGKKAAVVIDPFSKEKTGIKFEKAQADAILLSRRNMPSTDLSQIEGHRVVIDGPGEYEAGGISVIGRKLGEITTYFFKVDGLSLLHIGSLEKAGTDGELEKYPAIDVLFILAGKDAPGMVAKLEPKIVIPLYTPQTLPEFLKEIGKEDAKPQSKLTITKDKLPAEMEVAILE